jgi:hypothetical protein
MNNDPEVQFDLDKHKPTTALTMQGVTTALMSQDLWIAWHFSPRIAIFNTVSHHQDAEDHESPRSSHGAMTVLSLAIYLNSPPSSSAIRFLTLSR